MSGFLKIAVKIPLLILLIGFQALYSLQDPSVKDPAPPDEPQIDDSLSTNIQINDNFKPAKTAYLFLMKAAVAFEGGPEEKGMLYISNIFTLTVTNRVKKTLSIRNLSLYDIAKLEIVRWEARDKGNGDYLFVPVQYRLYTNLSGPGFVYDGNIDIFNTVLFEADGQKRVITTVYNDSWIEGRKNSFHWMNSKSPVFGYNFLQPLDGIAVGIKFDKKY